MFPSTQALRSTMKNRVLRSIDNRTRQIVFTTAALALLLAVTAAVIFCLRSPEKGALILEDPKSKAVYASYKMSVGDIFSIEFIHSVNKSPVTDYFEIRDDGIYGVKTVYYGFGAGVPTELGEGQTLSYGDDGSMIISGFNLKMNSLIYRVGTVSDHILTLPDGKEISLRDLCGRSARVAFRFDDGS